MSLIDSILQSRRIIITCGTGGVGKTTVSAALAVRAALLGKRVIVVTIDPAKRLATSLGLSKLGNAPADLTPLLRKAAGARPVPGSIHASMPDTRQTFESLVAGLTSNKASADRVTRNPIFRIFAREFSGANEYMAMQKLAEVEATGLYDCVILDTPPSRNTLAFLNAPQVLAGFFDERIMKWLVLPANRIVAGGMRKALSVLENMTGSGFMTHFFDFAASLFEVRLSFLAHLNRIVKLLESQATGFLLVTSPTPQNTAEVAQFIASIRERNFHVDAVLVNRTLTYLQDEGRDPPPPGMDIVRGLKEQEAHAMEELMQRLNSQGAPLHVKLPELARDVHSVEDLYYVALALDPSGSRSNPDLSRDASVL